jgi:nucleoside-diphosphate-sugar epimerase
MAPIVLRLPLVYGPGVKGNFAALLDEVARARPLPLGAIRNRTQPSVRRKPGRCDRRGARSPVAADRRHFVTDAESVSVPALVTAVGKALGNPVRLKAVPVRLLRSPDRSPEDGARRSPRRHAGSRFDVVSAMRPAGSRATRSPTDWR